MDQVHNFHGSFYFNRFDSPSVYWLGTGYRYTWRRDGTRDEIPGHIDHHLVTGEWWRVDFQVPLLRGRPIQYAIKKAEFLETTDGKYLVNPVGMNDTWSGPNASPRVHDTLESATMDLEQRVEYANEVNYKRRVGFFRRLLG